VCGEICGETEAEYQLRATRALSQMPQAIRGYRWAYFGRSRARRMAKKGIDHMASGTRGADNITEVANMLQGVCADENAGMA
jgi:hypothetical protein